MDKQMISYGAYMGSYREALPQQDFVNAAMGALKRQKLFIALGGTVLFILAALAIQFLPKSYLATASVEVLSKTPTVASPDILTNDQQFTDETVGTEVAILESRELRLAVVRQLHLLGSAEFNRALHPSAIHKAADWITSTLSSLGLERLGVGKELDGLLGSAPTTPERVLYETGEALARAVKIAPISHSRVIEVNASSRSPTLAAAIANAYVTEYIAVHQRQKEAAYKQAYDFSSARLPGLREDMLNKTEEVDRFRQENNIVSGQYAAIRREQLTEQMRQLIAAQTRLEELRAQAEQAKSGSALGNPAVLNSAVVARLREEETRIAAEGAGRGPEWLKQRLTAVDTLIAQEARRIVDSLPGQVAAQEAVVGRQTAQVRAIQREVARMDMLQSRLDPLENDARIAAKQYTDFLTSDSATKPDVAFTAVNVRVLSPAAIPFKANSPNNKLMLPAAFVLSFGCFTALGMRRGRRIGFASAAEFEEAFKIVPIGRVPFRTRQTESAYVDAVTFLTMRLSSPYADERQTILVTSSQPGEGKSTLARAMASAFAQRGVPVALIDADMRMSRAKGPVGLADVLGGSVTLEAVVRRDEGVTFVPPGTRASSPATLLATATMRRLIDEMKRTHPVVIIDSPPAPVGGDAWALSQLVEHILLVVKHSDTSRGQVEAALTALGKSSAKIAVVLNMVRALPGDVEDPFSAPMLRYYGTDAKFNRI